MNSSMFDLQKSDLYTPDYFLQDDVCRLCWNRDAKKEINENNLKNDEDGTNTIVDKIRYCLGLEVSEESYPKKACLKCFRNVEIFYDFKLFCHKTDRTLREILKIEVNTAHNLKNVSQSEVKEEKLEVPNFVLNKTDSLLNFLDSDLNMEESKAPFVEKHINYDDFTETELAKAVSLESLFDNLQSDENYVTEQLDIKKSKLNKKKYKHKRTSSYCNICHMDLANEEKFIMHNSEAHGVEIDGEFKCFGCEKKFKNRKTRLGHEVRFCKSLKEGYKCSNCERYLPNRKMYESHMRDHRERTIINLPEDIFKCIKCNKTFTTKGCLKKHMESHNKKKNFICESCGRIFSRQDYLHKHRLTHSGERQHACPHCPFRTVQRSSLIVHIRKHTGERPYSCDVCALRCVSSSNLRAHRRRHLGLKNYECSICQKKFGYKISLEEHIASTHERSQSYPCEYCGAIYTRLRGLRRHLVSKHAKDKSKTVLLMELGKPEKVVDSMEVAQSSSLEKSVLPTAKKVEEKQKSFVPNMIENSFCVEKTVLASDKDVIENQYYLKIVCVEASK